MIWLLMEQNMAKYCASALKDVSKDLIETKKNACRYEKEKYTELSCIFRIISNM